MARKRSRGKSRLTTLFWFLLTAVTGGGASGYLMPDTPFFGKLVQKLTGTSTGKPRDLLSGIDLGGSGGSILSDIDLTRIRARTGRGSAATLLPRSQRPADRVLIASFNIQVFGKSKMSKSGVVAILADVVRQFDIVAIQEIRAKEDDIMPRFTAAVNADGSRYNFVIGPRLGRTNSKEQYAFIYDTNRIEYDPSSAGNMSDPTDLLHREPFVTRFRVRTQSPNQAFTFWMVNVHTDPDEVAEEVDALADAFTAMQSTGTGEDDVILLGDLNASESQLGRLGRVPGIRWVVNGDVMTNTRKTKAYDNLLFHGQSTAEFTGRWGVFDLEQVFGISREEALKVSDHLPVWAEFHSWEAVPRYSMAEQSPRQRR